MVDGHHLAMVVGVHVTRHVMAVRRAVRAHAHVPTQAHHVVVQTVLVQLLRTNHVIVMIIHAVRR